MSNKGGNMKSNLVVNLIKAHCSGDEKLFRKALNQLVVDEERKGNLYVAKCLESSYKQPNNIGELITSEFFNTQSISEIPKDKDSSLELIEIIKPTIKLSDVALPTNIRTVLEQITREQKNFEKLMSRGVRPTNRVLFCGPPGCGKTMTANAIAGELEIPMAYVRLDGLVSSYLGQTGANLRKVFDFVKDKRILLFLDEFDAIGKKRDDKNELGELKRVVTTLLQNLDSLSENVVLVAATNHHHLLDSAIWRRFQTPIMLELPDKNQREQIISKYINENLYNYEIDLNSIVMLTDDMSGSQIINFLESLSKYCIMEKDTNKVTTEDLAKIWVNHKTLFISSDSKDYIDLLAELNNSGVSMRMIEKITGIPKSTLSYQFKKEERNG